jgi:hypothetical protein
MHGWTYSVLMIFLASFPALKPPEPTPFNCYLRTSRDTGRDDDEFAELPTFVAGESDTVEFFTSIEETQKVAAGGCKCVSISLYISLSTEAMYSTDRKVFGRCPQQEN